MCRYLCRMVEAKQDYGLATVATVCFLWPLALNGGRVLPGC